MREKIYTIPVTDAFRTICECPLCVLEKKLEDEALQYTLGPSMMEPDSRIASNEKGFCRHHASLLYGQKNRLSLGLILDTHLVEIIEKLKRASSHIAPSLKSKQSLPALIFKRLIRQKSEAGVIASQIIQQLNILQDQCVICEKISRTMERYIDVTIYLWQTEEVFRTSFKNSKGLCLYHFKLLLQYAYQNLNNKNLALLLEDLLPLQLSNIERIEQEVNWFTKKFDYRHTDAPWANSKDALPRSIEKINGYSRFSEE